MDSAPSMSKKHCLSDFMKAVEWCVTRTQFFAMAQVLGVRKEYAEFAWSQYKMRTRPPEMRCWPEKEPKRKAKSKVKRKSLGQFIVTR